MRFMRTAMMGLVLAGLGVHVGVAQQPASAPGDDLIGLWGGDAPLGPEVRGDLLLERHGRHWTLRVAGFESDAEQAGDSLVVRLPGGQGTLRAWVDGTSLEGFWVQPGADGPPYATPLRFSAAGAGAWRATVAPLDLRFPLYLSVSRAQDGALWGVFRNPEANWPGRAGAYRVTRVADGVAFTNARTGRVQYTQPYDSARRTLAFDFGAPIILTPRTREQTAGFVARSPALPPYEYRAPVPRPDGWATGPARAAGLDEAALQTIVRGLVATDPLSDSVPRVQSLLVARHGRLVLEEYFFGYGPDRLHDLRSASKTITSVMAGVAMRQGAPISMATRVDARAGSAPITVGHLLTHTSGLACDDDDDKSPGNEDTMQSQTQEPDWYRYFLALPTVHEPGTTYAYCSAGINFVGRVIGQSVHTWLPAFFDRTLARPLQITQYAMNLMPTGEAYAAGGLYLRPRDFLKFGQLYLNGGTWHGVRLVNAAWVAQSTARQVDRPDGSQDGFGWHRHELRAGPRRYQTYEASGNGGQFLLVVPELDLVVVATAGNYGQYAVWRRIREVLMPAVMQAVR